MERVIQDDRGLPPGCEVERDDSGHYAGMKCSGGSEDNTQEKRGSVRKKETPEELAARTNRVMGKLPLVAKNLPKLKEKIEQDLQLPDATKDRVGATVAKLICDLAIRVGSEKYAKKNGSYGASSLRKEHVTISGDELKLAFRGKSGVSWSRSIQSPELVNAVRHLQEVSNGDRLMMYRNKSGGLSPFDEKDAEEYMKKNGGGITPKNLRTYWATKIAAESLNEAGPPSGDEKKDRKTVDSVMEKVSSFLGNSKNIARASYVNPVVIEAWTKQLA